MHGQIRLQGRHGLPALAKRTAIKMDLPDKKGIGIIGRAYGMKKEAFKKEIKQEYGTVQSERIARTAVTDTLVIFEQCAVCADDI